MTKELEQEKMTTEAMTKALNEADAEWQALMKEDIEQFAPSINLAVEFDDKGFVRLPMIIRAWAKPVGWTDKKTKEPKATMVMMVEYEGQQRSLWLSAVSLKRSMMVIYQELGENAIGRNIVITRRPYDSKQYGASIAYNVDLVSEDAPGEQSTLPTNE